jgi:uncharacterized protein (DUF362 family)
MVNNSEVKNSLKKLSRRTFLRTIGISSTGLILAPYISSTNIFAYEREAKSSFLAKVGITHADNYERSFIKQKVQYLFEIIDGIEDVVKAGNKVAIKINLTGGGSSVPYNMWTHPEVIRAVGELLIDGGVKAEDIYIVEALWSIQGYNNYGYKDVQDSLGAKLIDLNKADPYNNFVQKEVGDNSFNFNSITMNQILADVDVYISIPKLKQHYEAGYTGALKNQVGMVPKDNYTTIDDDGRRGAIHHIQFEDRSTSKTHLPHSICDLNRARPVNLAVIDGIMNARGGEGTWNPTFQICEDHVLLAGKDPIATDSVAAYFLGLDPEAEKIPLPNPDDGECDNHLYLMNQLGIGTNKMSEIEVVGDGADLITSVKPYEVIIPSEIMLLQNYPNPFNPSTIIRFYLPSPEYVIVKIFNITGEEIETLMQGEVQAGQHEIYWSANHLASGVYVYSLQAGKFRESKKMILRK